MTVDSSVMNVSIGAIGGLPGRRRTLRMGLPIDACGSGITAIARASACCGLRRRSRRHPNGMREDTAPTALIPGSGRGLTPAVLARLRDDPKRCRIP
jgi:hypothetical protein